MRISQMEMMFEDISWFAIDQHQHIAYFTSGVHGVIPESVAACREDLDIVVSFFTDELEMTTTAYIDPDAFSRVKLVNNSAEVRSRVFEDDLEFGRKGLYCYDSISMKKFSGQYFKICSPYDPITVDSLPVEIASILRKTVIQNIYFNQCNLIPKDVMLADL